MYIRKIPSKEDSIINKNIQDKLNVVGLNCPRYKLPGNRTFLSQTNQQQDKTIGQYLIKERPSD